MNFDKLVAIGCSFTHGGGLETDIAYNYYNNTPNIKNREKVLQEFKYRNSYIAQLSLLMGGIEYENLSEGRASTEYILRTAYNRFKNNFENTLLILQPSFSSRKSFNASFLISVILYNISSLCVAKLGVENKKNTNKKNLNINSNLLNYDNLSKLNFINCLSKNINFKDWNMQIVQV